MGRDKLVEELREHLAATQDVFAFITAWREYVAAPDEDDAAQYALAMSVLEDIIGKGPRHAGKAIIEMACLSLSLYSSIPICDEHRETALSDLMTGITNDLTKEINKDD